MIKDLLESFDERLISRRYIILLLILMTADQSTSLINLPKLQSLLGLLKRDNLFLSSMTKEKFNEGNIGR